ncbi:Tannase/feruloyl esterase [Lentinula raphanica]|uniref:Carboxylic ester hydrolase n=1 Tax=Lentinula raphanica TaxID=153919 RepID=A0AA38UGI3_9AGAR|nr:Tannase/feruloyl esterase [Lentinula raphanica]KAJ3837347.1 Tannase/feruloyl esterase [Lentinula raphanica]
MLGFTYLLLTFWMSAQMSFAAPFAQFEAGCNNFASQVANSVANTTVFFAEVVPAGTNLTFPDQDPSCASTSSSQVVLADMCRVALNVSTSNDSGIIMEAWLPKNWTGRFLSTGNGGLGGCIQYVDLAYTTALGFATVGANNGHNGTSGASFYHNPEVLADFVYRSVHTSAVVGKEITRLFYGTPHNTSYYLGCSTGGRQGFKSMQDFPDDFDGIVAGAPGINWNSLMSWEDYVHSVLGNNSSPTFITNGEWLDLVHKNVMKQCDAIDGAVDGIIEDPNLCNYRPEDLLCGSSSSNSPDCLTAEQVHALRLVYSPLYNSNGHLMYPRQQPGSEDPSYIDEIFGGQLVQFSADWFRYVVYDPSSDLNTLNVTDWTHTQQLNPYNIGTWNGNLSAFRNNGGKMLTYQGQADMVVSPIDMELYYAHVQRTMSLQSKEVDDFMRLFRISGMSHCANGPGAWEIGQTLPGVGGQLTVEMLHPDRNVLTAMVKWVEGEVAPETIQGTKYVNDTKDLGVQFSRRHCRYPLRNTYDGVGDSRDPDSWFCQ